MKQLIESVRATLDSVQEALKGDQHKLDHDKDGDIDAKDFKGLRDKKKKVIKGGKDDTAEMNPKISTKPSSGTEEQKESAQVDEMLAALSKKPISPAMKDKMAKLSNKKDDMKKSAADKKAEVKDKRADADEDEKKTMKKESKIRSALLSVLGEDRAAHYKGATKPDEQAVKRNASAKKMADAHGHPANVADYDDEEGHDDASKAGRAGPKAKARPADQQTGDRKVMKKVKEAYASMYERT